MCEHGIPPNGSGTRVNRYSLLFDFRIPETGPWYCFFQTDPANGNDGDCFIRANDASLGVGQTGYSSAQASPGRWYRLVVSVDHSLGRYRLYLDGDLILVSGAQPIDGRFALDPTLLFFADENGEDAPIDVTTLAIYDVSLTDAEAAELGGAPSSVRDNAPPLVIPEPPNLTEVNTGQDVTYQVTVLDPDQDPVRLKVDWADGEDLAAWSDPVLPGQPIRFSHNYLQPGQFTPRVLACDEQGQTSPWTALTPINVVGQPVVTFVTAPYLQNVKPTGITVMWEMDALVPAELQYGETLETGRRMAASTTPSGSGTLIYRAVLTELNPSTRYAFRVWIGDQATTEGAFTTAPDAESDFAFSVWADSQGTNHDAYREDPYEPTKSMLAHMAESGVAFGIGVGDMAENGNAFADTHDYYLDRVAALLGRSAPWYVAWGNHDQGPGSLIRKYADLPSQDRPGFTAGYGSYSFDYGGCHFICIDHANAAADIVGWLEADLQSEAQRNAKFTFLFVHVPPYCELWIDGDAFYRSRLVPLMEAYGVDACFSGHTHEYSRGILNGVQYCITGGGSWLDFPEVLVHDWPHMTVGGFHAIPGVTKPGRDRGGGLINEYVRVEVHEDSFTASMIGFAPDGTEIGVLDTFSQPTGIQDPPAKPWLTGPTEVHAFDQGVALLESSAFVDLDPRDTHMQSVWRVSASPDAANPSEVLIEALTGANILTWSADLALLQPGRTVYATVRHVASDGQTSAFADPIAIRLTPDAIILEDFESNDELTLPPGWIANHRTTIDKNLSDPEDPRSNTYLTWTTVSADRLSRVFGQNRVNVPWVVHGQSVYAESDHRAGVQLQYLTTPDYDLANVTDVVLIFLSNYMQNQDSLGALEYSIDQGGSWLPVVYWLDTPDIARFEGTDVIDAVTTLTTVDPSQVPLAEGGAATGGTYGEHILSRPFSDLTDSIEGRLNDDPVESKRLERFRLPLADGQSHVRFRFTLVGTSSWFWGVDDFGLYGTVTEATAVWITHIGRSREVVTLEWDGAPGPYQLEYRASLLTGSWQSAGDPIPFGQRAIQLPANGGVGFYRLRVDR